MARKAGKAKLKAPRTTSRLKEKRRVSNQKAPTQIKGKSKRLQKQAAKLEAAISTTKVKKNTKGKDTKKTIQLLEKIEIPKTNQRGKKVHLILSSTSLKRLVAN